MADGDFNLKLDDYTSAKLAEKAKAIGMSPEELASLVLDQHFFDYDDFTWINGDPHDHDPEEGAAEETGRPWSEVRPEFLALSEKTFGKAE